MFALLRTMVSDSFLVLAAASKNKCSWLRKQARSEELDQPNRVLLHEAMMHGSGGVATVVRGE